jgi:hypothetical protein
LKFGCLAAAEGINQKKKRKETNCYYPTLFLPKRYLKPL